MIQRSDDIKKLFNYLLLTSKNVSLYPEGHSISANSIKQFHENLEAYIRKYGDIRIEIERDRVLCQGAEVHKGTSEEGSLHFTLFRDGIRWLEFTEGIRPEETRDALFIIRKYSTLAQKPEGDIVTAFWEAHFDHVLYRADDFVGDEPSDLTDGPSTNENMPSSAEAGTETEAQGAANAPPIDSTSFGGLAIDPVYFELTPEEKIELQEMIAREEKLSATDHLNMYLDMLLQFQEEKDFNIVLGVLSEEFDAAYAERDFAAALVIIDGVRKILDSGQLRTPPAQTLIQSFYKDISSDTRCLKPLKEIWSSLTLPQIETLKMIFKHLPPAAVDTLLRFLILGQSSQLEQIVSDTIFSLIARDASCLEAPINYSNERILEKLIPILSRLDGSISLKYLLKLARHTSVSVRRTAVKAIGQVPGNQVSVMFEFIGDPDLSVRQVILAQIGQSRNETSEDLMMEYLRNRKFGPDQTDYVLECFRALGKCGSARSIPFLNKIFLHRSWMAALKKSSHREGAAYALAALNIPEARQIIESAGRSFNWGLRRIAQEAGKEYFRKQEEDRHA